MIDYSAIPGSAELERTCDVPDVERPSVRMFGLAHCLAEVRQPERFGFGGEWCWRVHANRSRRAQLRRVRWPCDDRHMRADEIAELTVEIGTLAGRDSDSAVRRPGVLDVQRGRRVPVAELAVVERRVLIA